MMWKEFGSLGTSKVSIMIRNPWVSGENSKGLWWCFNGVSTKRVWVSHFRVIVVITFFFSSSVSFKCNWWILIPKTLPSTLLLQEEAPFELELVAISRILIYKFQLFGAACPNALFLLIADMAKCLEDISQTLNNINMLIHFSVFTTYTTNAHLILLFSIKVIAIVVNIINLWKIIIMLKTFDNSIVWGGALLWVQFY